MMKLAVLLVAAVPGVTTDPRSSACGEEAGTCSSLMRESMLLQKDSPAGMRKSPLAGEDVQESKLPAEWAVGAKPQQRTELEPNVTVVASLIQDAELMLLGSSPTSKELQHFRNIKAERARGWRCPDGTYYPPNNGEFEWDCRLWRAAKGWSMRMGTENFAGHVYQGSTSCQRTNAQGFPRDQGCGENLALGLPTSEEAIVELKKSKEHCKNFFDPSYNKLGVGFFYNPSADFKYYWTDNFGAWHQAPDQSCIGGSPAPVPAPGCADIDTYNCQYYKSQNLCSVSPNVQAQCKDTCGIGNCGSPAPAPRGPSPVPAPSGSCQDTVGSCDYYRSKGYCANNDNVKTGCKKTCGLCCQDTVGSCDYYRSKGYCANNDNVKTGCKKTCGLCCQDTVGSCDYYRSKGYCLNNDNVKNGCRKTCRLC